VDTGRGGNSWDRRFVDALTRVTSAFLLALILLLVVSTPAFAAGEDSDLLSLSLEDLLAVEVTSVSKKAERGRDAAAAVYVLTAEDIRRSTARSIPELLRTVPGISVARLNSSMWSATARGFGGRFANKLLVLIDGRSVYTPLFSGVYWEAQDVVLEDVARIEVIRGPGGTIWGANAVNGVINIVTKSAEETQGLLISGGGGSEEQGFGTGRWGGTIGENAWYRVYSKYFTRDDGGSSATGSTPNDEWDAALGGFRIDWDPNERDQLTISGETLNLDQDESIVTPVLAAPFTDEIQTESDTESAHLLMRWTRQLNVDSELRFQTYWDYYSRRDFNLDERRNTLDFTFEHALSPHERHHLVYGLGFRYTRDNLDTSEFIRFDESSQEDTIFNAFIQDEIALTDTLDLILGTKLEHNSYTGIEIQPSARMRWTPNPRHTLWGAVSRAVRTPSRAEEDIQLRAAVFPGPIETILQGQNSFEAEDLLAFELGYRTEPTDNLALDLALFYNRYDDLRSLEPGTPFPGSDPDVTVLPFLAENGTEADAFGIELALDWSPKPWWQLRTGYTFLLLDVDAPSADPITASSEDDTPTHQGFITNHFNLPRNFELDTTLRFVGELDGVGFTTETIDSYVEFDARIAWRPKENIEFALIGRNLFDSEHFEFSPTFVNNVATTVERSVFAQMTWEFQPGRTSKTQDRHEGAE